MVPTIYILIPPVIFLRCFTREFFAYSEWNEINQKGTFNEKYEVSSSSITFLVIQIDTFLEEI